jgi:CRISPR-associated protein Csy1
MSTSGVVASRNAPCPCGSGKRYKDCHGRIARAATPPEPLVRALALEQRLLASGLVAQRRSGFEQALACYERVLALDGEHPDAWHLLARLDLARSAFDAALAKVERAIAIHPGHAAFHETRREVLRGLGKAADDSAQAVEQPDEPLGALVARAVSLRAEGSLSAAENALRFALRREPKHEGALALLGAVLREMLRFDEAAAVYRELIDLDSKESPKYVADLARCLVQVGRTPEAQAVGARALERWPNDLRVALPARLLLKAVYDSPEDLAASRRQFAEGIAWLRGSVARFASAEPKSILAALDWTNFYLAYQGGDDVSLQSAYADFAGELLDVAVPHLRQPIPRREVGARRIRIGFASHYFYQCSAGTYFRKWIESLDRTRFEIFVYHVRPSLDAVGSAIREVADHFRQPSREVFFGDVIRADDLDILLYPELGGDGLTFLLATLRLAPVQCAGWGHPVTTGHGTIDYFFSSDVMEPADAQSHYRERLVRLPGIGTDYTPPALPEHLTRTEAREQLGLPIDRHLYLFPQSIYKIHPDNDLLLAGVLAADPQGSVLFFGGHTRETTEQFLQRFAGVLDRRGMDIRERAILLPITSRETYLRINTACDVMLDSLHWSGGNTSLDAIAVGLPVVTLPGRFMRGRQTYGMLRVAGVPELIAEDQRSYVALACRLARDAAFRASVVHRLQAGKARLFDDRSAIDAMQAFYRSLVKT